ncbi:amidohydrolase family protein [Curtobacterium sp. VKM Ac-2865]|uniref:N-acetylglucosamine-6-phosphate deacetylase n=1 Tax=Curtobacterium sp. VKM Ac-2865 TaxID=2783817 RepID=UPI00188BA794|nr:amidohydrolase family protein [Curtobacterium sp. VKM Ac-2865]MBF4582240.1 amidohydrolase family protein [Curtobacterium sp. VKM Ac-2865]
MTARDLVVPGFVDLHVHGALGHDFASCSADQARAAVAHHASRGTTTMVASIATGTPDATVAALRRLGPLVDEGVLAGLHLEGPWLSPARRGAHAAELLHAPTPAEVDTYLDAAAGTLRVVTLAPELPGALDAVARLTAAGVVVAIGHTDADADTVTRAVDAGARLVSHVFNGMPPLHHRAPGPVGVALTDPRLHVEAIVDGHHLDDVTVDLVRRSTGGRMVLVSDAMAATGCDDGRYRIAGSDVVVSDGVAMLADGSSLAGSTSTVLDGFLRLLAAGTSLDEAVAASSGRALALLGLPASPARIVVDTTTASVRPHTEVSA